jgi:hypothetical protein
MRHFLWLAFALTAGCTTVDPLYCDEDSQCTDPSRPFCDLAGEHAASGGVARTCIPDPNGDNETDAGTSDGPDTSRDAGAEDPDARVFSYPEPQVYWAFDKKDVSGAVLVARHGELSGALEGPSVTEGGVVADAIALAGGADQVDFGDALDDVFSGSDRTFSISVWVKPVPASGSQAILVKAGGPSCDPPEDDTRQLELLLDGGVPGFRFWTPANANARFLVADTPLGGDSWHHILVTYDGANDVGPAERVRVYTDGVLQPLTVTGSLGDFPYDIQETGAHFALGNIVGAGGESCGQGLTAQLDELAVWSSVLGAEHAAEVYERGTAAQPLWPR